ncbi:hypothetical protein P0Y43_02260 [Pseudomonas entomophila]|uniref:hypothetical protein n=1 Tax=Pseudomonas entomophila TaxID=312306 RepID=UPI0023D82C55|nr:hypothetical protein [Pseudomonas entomophila]MDF0729549.1 hypothetical protein [Pseudomonas entomophila]
MDEQSRKSGDSWWSLIKWIAISLMALGVISPLIILGVYAHSLGGISHAVDAWSAFGSLLAGIFTLLAALATTSTLLLLIYQQTLTRETTVKQLQALTFDQYNNHRQIFIQRLKDLEYRFDGRVRFKSYDELYGWIFPLNTPLNVVYASSINQPSIRTRSLSTCRQAYDALVEAVKPSAPDTSLTLPTLVKQLDNLKDNLGVTYTAKAGETCGDVTMGGRNTGINIFNPGEALERLEYIFNSFLFYSGNPTVTTLRASLGEPERHLLVGQCLEHADLEIHKDTYGLTEHLLRLYHLIGERDNDGKRPLSILESRVHWLMEDPDRVQDYARDADKLEKILNVMEARMLRLPAPEGDDDQTYRQMVERAWSLLHQINRVVRHSRRDAVQRNTQR